MCPMFDAAEPHALAPMGLVWEFMGGHDKCGHCWLLGTGVYAHAVEALVRAGQPT